MKEYTSFNKDISKKLLDMFDMSDYTQLSLPMNPRTKLSKKTNSTLVDPKMYQSLVSQLLHATINCWDI